jgi:amino acid adenylation domain-containing protein
MQPTAAGAFDATLFSQRLMDVLARAAPSTHNAAISRYICNLDSAVWLALQARAARLGLATSTMPRAALALLVSRLTGDDRVAIHAPEATKGFDVFSIPITGGLDAWLVGATGGESAQDADMQPSVIGAWALENLKDGSTACVPLVWSVEHAAVSTLAADFSQSLFDTATVAVLAQGLRQVLQGLATAQQLEDITACDADQHRLIARWNATAVVRYAQDSVHGLFAAVAERHAGEVAIAWAGGEMSYAELDARSNAAAAGLLAAGVTVGSPVALLIERSAEAIVAMLGILKAGAAYLPLDPGYPPERLVFTLADAHVSVVIAPHAICNNASADVCWLTLEHLEIPVTKAALPPGHGESLAYVMYTSGSSGAPKGVEIAHRSIIRLVRDVRYVAFGDRPRILHAAPLGFDACTFELWGALLNGGICVIHDERIPSGAGLAATIQRHDVRIAWLTAALFNAIVDSDARDLRGLQQLLIGGEALSVIHVRKAYAALPDITLINGYGPTECTTFAATYDIPRDLAADARCIPIGRPIADTTLHVVNTRCEPVPLGVIGELLIGGAGLARGYRHRPELTAERFIAGPAGIGERLYRTGDQVRWRRDGVLEFIGRIDGQVKIRGYRIEVGEIEAALQQVDGIRGCAVLAREDHAGQRRLVAYVVTARDADVTMQHLREQLARRLPAFMLPTVYLRLNALPVTANGKLDRRALPAPDQRRPELSMPYAPGVGVTEQKLCELFAELLGLDHVGRNDSFFELGGNSLLAMTAVARMREGFASAPTIVMLFSAPTPATLGALLVAGDTSASANARMPRGSAARRDEPIAIVAMAGRFPGAHDVDAFWHNLCAGTESITYFRDAQLDPGVPLDVQKNPDYVAARGIIDGAEKFDAAFFGIPPREAELMDPQQRIFLELCWECMERGGQVPDAHDGPVGVFGGMHNATYFQKHLLSRPDLIDKLGAFQVMLANEKDFFATRVAHRLNLTGPAISINTACSTSLVAIAQAVDALRAGRCEMALAGGVSIHCPPRSGYLAQEGTMLSPDGHTRSFDASAGGTVFSDGAGVVLLKRLADAIADGNPIHALIRGVAVNNDGSGKASFMAPSSAGQAAVVAMAHMDAGVDARSISYVEAHGTATPIGDPIELQGLTEAFRRSTSDCAFCRIGSVKSNIGHVVTAAGVAGVIKTAFALREHQLPATLHFRAPNPAFELADSPFVVNDRLTHWPATNAPRRAGVSSFGVGGTNAHIVMEEAPVPSCSDAATGPSLLVLSARSAPALAAAALKLSDYLGANLDVNLADVAWTLAVGRKAFAHRLAVVVKDPAAAVAQLTDTATAAAVARSQPAQPCDVVFLFPGQGAQYAGMGRELYATEPAFREAFDACVEGLRDTLGFDLRERVFSDDAAALLPTAVMQPAIFAVEYALAKLWMSLGVTPSAMIGHSVGEFVAATLAGVFDLRDALHLVARRGALMQAQPVGSMLSVRLPRASLSARLPAGLSLAAENTPGACVVAGPHEAVALFQTTLEADGVACRQLNTSHAFHSAMMDAVLAPFHAEVDKIARRPSQRPLVSTSTGDWLGADEAMSSDYWTNHLRRPVLFSRALSRVLDAPSRVLLEVGPRGTLSALARQQLAAGESAVLALPSLADSPDGEVAAFRLAAGRLWCRGLDVHPESFDRRHRRHRLLLPTYSFERQRHWVDVALASPALPVPVATTTHRSDATIAAPASIEERTMHAPTPAGADRRPRLIAELKAAFEDVAGIDMADADGATHFIELGLDSLMLTQMAMHLSKLFPVKITFRQLMADYSSLDQLAGLLDERLPAEAAIAPVMAAAPWPVAPAASAGAPTAYMQQVIDQQMQLMAQQLALLAGSAAMATPAATAMPAASSLHASASPAPADTPLFSGVPSTGEEEAALAHTRYDVKKAFGAIARIDNGAFELSARQHERLDRFIERYVARTAKSKHYTQAHRAHMADPRVVNGFRPMIKEIIYQIVIERSKGAHLWDLDGNRYVDALNGFGMSLFGWQPDFVLDAVRKQLDLGYEIGPQHPLSGEVARLVCELTGHDRAALCNTGSEAVLGAMRIARTVTGRSTIVLFTGSYHGIVDEVIVRGTKKRRAVPAAPGILRNTAENVMVLDYGTPESLQFLREHAHELAAVLIEPVQSRRPDFQPVDFLHEVRDITTAAGALCIFDEIVTGFRAHPGGTQAMFGIKADLATYGKVVGGGYPIGVIAGKREYMDALDGGAWQFGDDSVPTVGVTYFAGTFVRHPLALAAAHAVLEHMKAAGPALQERLNTRVASMVDELNAFCREVGAPIAIKHFASVWKTQFLEEHPLQDLLFAMMRSRGIHILDNFPCFFTTAHSEADFVAIATAYKDSVLELQDAEFLPRSAATTRTVMDASQPPVPGARLGREPDGRPCWFVPHPDQPGKFLKVNA